MSKINMNNPAVIITINACFSMLINILFVTAVMLHYRKMDFIIEAEHLILALCGGGLSGVSTELMFRIPFLALYFFYRFVMRSFFAIQRDFWDILLFFIRLNLVWFVITIKSIIALDGLSVRGCAGAGFFIFVSSAIWLIKKRNLGPFFEIGVGLLSPSVTLYFVAFGIKNDFVSWYYFYD